MPEKGLNTMRLTERPILRRSGFTGKYIPLKNTGQIVDGAARSFAGILTTSFFTLSLVPRMQGM